MRGVLHAEVFGFNFSTDINPYQRSDGCVIAAGQIMERPHDVKAVRYTQLTLGCGRKVHSQTDFTSPPDWNPYGMCMWRRDNDNGTPIRWGGAEGLRPRSVRMSTPECVDLKKV